MKISILIPVYNVEQYIQRCIKSVLKQTYKDLEIIVVDDHSPDNSIPLLIDAISDYPDREKQVKIIRHNKNLGLAQARNSAILAATGTYVFHLDSDDYLLEDSVIDYFVKLAKQTGADIIEGDFIKIYSKENNVKEIIQRKYSDKMKVLKNIIIKKDNFTVWNKLIRKELYQRYRIYAQPGINYGEDYVTTPRLYYHASKIVHLPLFSYGYNLENTTSFFANRTNWNNLFSMIDSNRFLYAFFKEKHEKLLVKYVDVMYLETMAHLLLNCCNKCEIKNVSEHFTECHYRNIIAMRPKLILILLIYLIGLHSVLLRIGKIYRKR